MTKFTFQPARYYLELEYVEPGTYQVINRGLDALYPIGAFVLLKPEHLVRMNMGINEVLTCDSRHVVGGLLPNREDLKKPDIIEWETETWEERWSGE